MKFAARAGTGYPLWAFLLPCVLAIVVAGLLVVVDLVGMIMGSWDTPIPGLRWLKVGAIGQGVLVVAAAALLIVGLTHPRWRQGAALAGWGLIVLEAGWFLLTRVAANP